MDKLQEEFKNQFYKHSIFGEKTYDSKSVIIPISTQTLDQILGIAISYIHLAYIQGVDDFKETKEYKSLCEKAWKYDDLSD